MRSGPVSSKHFISHLLSLFWTQTRPVPKSHLNSGELRTIRSFIISSQSDIGHQATDEHPQIESAPSEIDGAMDRGSKQTHWNPPLECGVAI